MNMLSNMLDVLIKCLQVVCCTALIVIIAMFLILFVLAFVNSVVNMIKGKK